MTRAKWILVIVVALLGLYFMTRPANKEEVAVLTISPADYHAAKDKYFLLDVRTPEEYAEKHIPGSVLIPVTPEDEFRKQMAERIPDRKTGVAVYCRSGRRSGIAVGIMREMGYVNAYNLGGINDWPYETERVD